MFERYTERARRAIYFARWWALQRETSYIETSDIILGAAHDPFPDDSPIRWMHEDLPRFTALFAKGLVCVQRPAERTLPLSDSAKRALAYAVDEAGCDKRYSIEVHHLFRGVLRTGDEVSQQLLEAGYTIEAVRENSRAANAQIPDTKMRLKEVFWGPGWGLRLRRREYVLLVCVSLAFLSAILYLRSQN